jgi:GNAT superfamily N-acetyltransferase
MKSEAENIILYRFGIPKIGGVESEELKLKTNDRKIPGSNEENYFCTEHSFKFCLVNNEEPIFTMDFFKASTRMLSLRNEEPYIKLELLYVHKDSLRNKGIATYYMKKLVQYAKDEGISHIKILANPNADNFKRDKKVNALNKTQLITFYKKFEDEKIKIDILQF